MLFVYWLSDMVLVHLPLDVVLTNPSTSPDRRPSPDPYRYLAWVSAAYPVPAVVEAEVVRAVGLVSRCFLLDMG